MEELEKLRKFVEEHDYAKALEIVSDLEEMSKEDKLNKIYSYCVILLIHLIKQKVEQRTTRSWEVSIRNSVREINRTNHRRKSGGTYANEKELLDTIYESIPPAVDRASLEVKEGIYEATDLMALFDSKEIATLAFDLIQNG